MADVTINLTSQPNMPKGTVLNRGSWTFTNSRLQSNSIGNDGRTNGYIQFNATPGTVRATIGCSSESGYDYMSLHVSTTSAPPSRGSGNMANASGTNNGTQYTYSITSAGVYYLHFSYAKDSSTSSGFDIGWITQAILPVDPDATIIMLGAQPNMPSGSELVKNSWVFSNNRLQSNSISHNGQTSGYIKFNAIPGMVTASIGCSSESSYDYMMLHVSTTTAPPNRKEANMTNIAGNYDGETYSYNITSAGTYYLHFSYAKDGSNSNGSDAGWIYWAKLPMAKGPVMTFNNNGTFAKSKGVWYNDNGTWKPAKAMWYNDNGTWKPSK